MLIFPCIQCGLCCQHVHVAIETQMLDRGDGTCRHYNEASKQCSVYADRPDICRVDRQYVLNYVKLYSWDEFIELNLQVCHQLIEQSKGSQLSR